MVKVRVYPPRMYVVVWSKEKENTVEQIHPWLDWQKLPIMERPFGSTMVRATDELDAYVRAMRGEEWYAGNQEGAD